MKLPLKFIDFLALIVLGSIIFHSYIKGIDMTETYKAIAMAIIMYYYGSSKSSANKDVTIQELRDTAAAKPDIKVDTVNTENVETVNTNMTNIKE